MNGRMVPYARLTEGDLVKHLTEASSTYARHPFVGEPDQVFDVTNELEAPKVTRPVTWFERWELLIYAVIAVGLCATLVFAP